MQNIGFKISVLAFISGVMTACAHVPILNTNNSVVKSVEIFSKKHNVLDLDTVLETAYQRNKQPVVLAPATDSSEQYFHQFPNTLLESNVLAFMHPVITYTNVQGEFRYLVIMETAKYYDGYISSCRACSSQVDILVYKKQGNQFVLTGLAKNQEDIPSSNGHLMLDFQKQFKENVQKFGANMMGSYVYATFTGAGGQEESLWYGILLPDNAQPQAVQIGHAGGSTASFYADRPEMASTVTSTLKVIQNQSVYFPIEVTYIDENQPKKPYKSIFQYETSQQVYVEKKVNWTD